MPSQAPWQKQSDRGDDPTMVAAVDIGSNSVRMVVAQVRPDGSAEVIERARRPIRLGHDTFVTGKLSQESMRAAISILRDYRKILDTYQVEAVRAVATSAVREASNMDAFLDRVARTVGLDVEVIETTEQSRLVVAAVRDAVGDAVDLKKGNAAIVEVGGGSTLLTVLQKGEIGTSESFNLGAIRLQENLGTAQESPLRAAEMLHQHVSQRVSLMRKALGLKRVKTFVAIGGDARFAADQVGQPIADTGLFAVGSAALDEIVERCLPLSAERLVRRFRLPYEEAETLVPALLTYQALLGATGASRMVVAQVSMREGLLLDMPRYVTGEQDPALTEGMILSARTLGAKYQYDEAHSEQVTRLAQQLFDELSDEHGLGPRHRLLLTLAAVLHDIGAYVSSRAHHKHTQYLVVNSEIFGLQRDDLNIVSQVARYHRRSEPKSSHPDYMALPRTQRMVVNKLAAILRVADALDRGHMQQVREFVTERQGGDLVIYVRGATDLTLERRSIADKCGMFEDIFGMRVRVEEEAAVASGERGTAASKPTEASGL
jgi:exopolyphosphatase/guanosine-5'-triphosphate,3'-diphosphate pyrophosphatase